MRNKSQGALINIYNRRPTELELSFNEWLERVRHRADVAYGTIPQNDDEILFAIQRKIDHVPDHQ